MFGDEQFNRRGETMLKTLGAQVKEYKKASIATPVFMILEVIMEMIIPLMMASIIGFTSSLSVRFRKIQPGWWLACCKINSNRFMFSVPKTAE